MKDAKKTNLITAAVICVVIAAFIIVANRIAPFLLDNDNIYLKTVASGEMTGRPEAHMYYIDYVFGIIVTFLYSLTGNSVPWFGLLLVLCMGAVIFFVTYVTSSMVSRLSGRIATIIVSLILMLSFFFRYFVDIQYTIVAGMLGAGAVFALLSIDQEKTIKENLISLIFFGCFSLLSYSVRNNAFIMCFPFLGMAFVAKFFDASKKKNRVIFASALTFIGVLVFSFGVHKIVYISDEWKIFEKYTAGRTVLLDYYGWPDYDTHKGVYDDHGVLRSSYEAATQHYNLILDPNINADFFKDLSVIAAKDHLKSRGSFIYKAADTVKTIIRRNFFDYDDRPLNVLVYFLYLFTLVLAIAGKKIKALRDILFLIVARSFDWFYLVYEGRYPFRVTQIIYICELFWLLYIVFYRKLLEFERKSFSIAASSALVVMITVLSIRFGLPISRNVKERALAFDDLSVSFRELENYFEDHSDNFYFFDMSNLHYMERALDFRKRPYENYVYMGSWMVSSPWYDNKLKEKGISNPATALMERDDLFIVYQVTDGYSRDFLDDFYSEHYPGSRIEKADELISSNGFVYEILKVCKN